MKKILAVLALSLLSCAAHAAAPVALNCDLIETPTGTNDSWGLTILGERIAFWDNDSYSFGTWKEEPTGDDDWEYKSLPESRGGGFHVILANPAGRWAEPPFIAELYLGRGKRPEIFSCKPIPVKEAKEIFESADPN
jgi:hypothetical protein